MLPAHERLGADDFVRLEVVDRLREDAELPILQAEFHIAHKHLFLEHLLAHAFIVVAVALDIAAAHPVQRHARPVAHLVDGQEDVLHRVDARIKDDMVADAQRAERAVEPRHEGFHLHRILWHAECKMIRFQPPDHAFIPHGSLEIVSRRLQDQVARLHAEQVVDNLEAAHVEVDNHVGRIGTLLHEP